MESPRRLCNEGGFVCNARDCCYIPHILIGFLTRPRGGGNVFGDSAWLGLRRPQK
jgi:hypothetical protein